MHKSQIPLTPFATSQLYAVYVQDSEIQSRSNQRSKRTLREELELPRVVLMLLVAVEE